MSDRKFKVTDKRMFTPNGELRDEFRNLSEGGDGPRAPDEIEGPEAEEAARSSTSTPTEKEREEAAESASGRAGSPADASTRVEMPFSDQVPGQPTFLDLVGLLAQPIALYLGDARLPEGESMENLELARLHIDLLEVLRQKTGGNLSAQESTFLDDLLYQLRLRYVQKGG